MSISLNNHESRIKTLESDIQVSTNDTKFISTAPVIDQTAQARPLTTLISFKHSKLKIMFGSLNIKYAGSFSFELPAHINLNTSGLGVGYNMTDAMSTPLSRFRFIDDYDKLLSSNKSGIMLTTVEDHATLHWIAIGILYAYRYIINSLLIFTPLSYLLTRRCKSR